MCFPQSTSGQLFTTVTALIIQLHAPSVAHLKDYKDTKLSLTFKTSGTLSDTICRNFSTVNNMMRMSSSLQYYKVHFPSMRLRLLLGKPQSLYQYQLLVITTP